MDGSDPLGPLLSQGILGVVLVLVISLGVRVYREMKAVHARELEARDAQIAALREDRAAVEAALAEETRFVRDEVMPALTRSVDLAQEYVEVLSRRAQGGP
ncbi:MULTISPECIES: hypothetical protein [Frankia]|uniref:Uncharacterized protein n=1 Tax=Frankia alni (strain DSM 45986 / CECT 9034 / ACN14a) TaxID=326424 RepID=Q0RME4_FRAAA|nr:MULTISPECIES: hypothetical protein [Frankia]CAJ61307.1 hypothetical protein FRAAL2661 [Frankia alni ACN14a]